MVFFVEDLKFVFSNRLVLFYNLFIDDGVEQIEWIDVCFVGSIFYGGVIEFNLLVVIICNFDLLCICLFFRVRILYDDGMVFKFKEKVGFVNLVL